MDPNERELFMQLITAAGTLATVTDNAAVIISEELDEMVRPQIEAVREILARCPVPEEMWKPGDPIREDDLMVEHFRAEGQGPHEDPKGVKITHLPTGLSGESYSKRSRLENTDVVMTYIRRKLEERVVAS